MNDFFKWLEANGFHYTPGDYHWTNSGWWFPAVPADLSNAEVPGPFVWVQRDKENDAAFVTRQGSAPEDRVNAYVETAERGIQVASEYLMAYDRELDVGSPWTPDSEFEGFGDFGASSSGPAGRFVQDWVNGRLAPRKTKEAALWREVRRGGVDTLYSYAVPIASILDQVGSLKQLIADGLGTDVARGEYGPEMAVLSDQLLGGGPLPEKKYLVIGTRESLERTSVTTNRHLSWVDQASKGAGVDGPMTWGEPPFPPGHVAYQTEGRVPTDISEWRSALEEFAARAAGRPSRLRGAR